MQRSRDPAGRLPPRPPGAGLAGPSLRHRLVNLAQSALLVAGMAALAWAALAQLLGPATTAAVVAGTALGLLSAPALPTRMTLASYGARRLDPWRFPRVVALVADLAGRAGLRRPPALYYLPSPLPNAFALGSPGDSAICVTDGLLRLLSRREFAAVLAHEIAHIAHRDLWIMGVADAIARIVAVAAWLGLAILLLNLPLLLSGAGVVPWTVPLLLVVAPGLAAVLQRALSRLREFDADRGAVALTGDPAGLASALLRLERGAGGLWRQILLPGRRGPDPSVLRTHPPTAARIARLRALAGAA